MNKKFISIIWWYHKQIFSFDKKQNYHMLPIEAMQEEWFECEIFAIDSQVKIEDDPNFIAGTKVIYYKWFLDYLIYLFKNRNAIIYSNSLTIKTLLVWIIWKKTVFMAHDQVFPLENKKIKQLIVKFFYRFFSFIRVINKWESELLNKLNINNKILPLSISDNFLNTDFINRRWWIFIWNLYADKNPEFLIIVMKEIIKKYPDFILKIAWEDRYNKNWLKFSDIINNEWLSKNILILWFIPHNRLKNLLSESLIYINTSISEWQCLAVYEASLSGCILCLQNILSFPSVLWKNALYHSIEDELIKNIDTILKWNFDYININKENQKMILEKYNYDYIKSETKKMFLQLN